MTTVDEGASRGVRRLIVPAAAVATGAFGAITLILAQRHLDLEAFAPLAQLWTIWAVLAAGLTFSFQQWAAVLAFGRRSLLPGGDAQRLGTYLGVLAVLVFAVTGVARETIFQSSALVWPAAAAVLPLGTALNGVRRGQLARHGQDLGLATVIAGENAIRLLCTVALILADAAAPWFAGALLAGFAVIAGPAPRGTADVHDTDRRGYDTLGAAAVAGFLAHVFMFGSPLFLAAAGGDAAQVSALFLVLTGVRVPFIVLQAVVPQLSTGLAASADRRRAVARTRYWLVVAAFGGGAGAAVVGYVLGDLVIGTVFDIRGEVDSMTYALLSAASVLAACALLVTVTLVVEGRSRQIAAAWALPAVSVPFVVAAGVVAEPEALAAWLVLAHAAVVVAAVAGRNRPATSVH